MLQAVAIVVFSIFAAVVYGVVHDQVTARICIEYFTIGHPPIFRHPVSSPTVIGLAWGVIATWWVGAGLGIFLALAASAGRKSPRSVGSLVVPIAILMGVTATLAAVSGLLGYLAAQLGWVELIGTMAARVPAEKHSLFIADLWAHSASYFFGAIGGIVLIARTWRSRKLRC